MTDQPIVVLLGSAWPLRGGLANFNERLIREFNSYGYKSCIYTFSLQYPGILFPGKSQYSTEPAPKDLEILVKVNSINPFNWIKVGLQLKKLRPDIVLVKFWIPFMAPCFGTITRIAKRNKHTQVISIIDNIIPHEKRPGDKMLARFWVKSADGFIVMSKSVMDDLQTFDTRKPKILSPHPIYDNFGAAIGKKEARKLLGLEENGKYLLFFGFIRDYKGLDILLKAMDHDILKDKDLKLIVAGEYYTDPKPYQQLIKNLHLEDRVILHTDFIPDSEVYKYFCAADLVVQPYKHATQSGVTQIAYHFDKPMIITNVGGLKEFVPHDKVGYCVEPDTDSVAHAINDFYVMNKEDDFIAGVRTEKARYGWGKMVEAVRKLIHAEE